MTTLIDFQPNALAPFAFKATLDEALYDCLVTWNFAGQRYYLNIHDDSSNLIVCLPVIASPQPRNLAAPPSTEDVQSMTWNDTDGGRVYFIMAEPSTVVLGGIIDVSGATNDGLAGDGAVNGQFVVDQWTDSQNFSALLTALPGEIGTIAGDVVINIQAYALEWIRGVVIARSEDPHKFPLGSVVELTIANAVPTGYNGKYFCVISGPDEFRFGLPTNPGGPSTVSGTYSQDISLTKGYFDSTLIYRKYSQRFEISP